MDITQIAKVAHEINAAYCLSQGDNTQPTWEYAPAWQRDSAMAGVAFHLANPDASASASHDSWLEDKKVNGWIYGEVKDAEAKTHPCFVPFEDLPKSQQAKDYLFKQIVHSLSV